MPKYIDHCPICGGELQSTVERYTSGVVLSENGAIVDTGKVSSLEGETRVYCENDHMFDAILAAYRRKPRTFLETKNG